MNKVIIAFTSGVILGLLYAPQKGKNTRNKIANVGNDLKQKWNNVTDRLACKIDDFRDRVDTIADNAVEKVESTQFDTGEKSYTF